MIALLRQSKLYKDRWNAPLSNSVSRAPLVGIVRLQKSVEFVGGPDTLLSSPLLYPAMMNLSIACYLRTFGIIPWLISPRWRNPHTVYCTKNMTLQKEPKSMRHVCSTYHMYVVLAWLLGWLIWNFESFSRVFDALWEPANCSSILGWLHLRGFEVNWLRLVTLPMNGESGTIAWLKGLNCRTSGLNRMVEEVLG